MKNPRIIEFFPSAGCGGGGAEILLKLAKVKPFPGRVKIVQDHVPCTLRIPWEEWYNLICGPNLDKAFCLLVEVLLELREADGVYVLGQVKIYNTGNL
jgi:hypothetical protein